MYVDGMTTTEVLMVFDAALELDATSPDSDEAIDAQNAAFDAAKAYGWDWEEAENGEFASWCLKATPTEILQEGRSRFRKFANG